MPKVLRLCLLTVLPTVAVYIYLLFQYDLVSKGDTWQQHMHAPGSLLGSLERSRFTCQDQVCSQWLLPPDFERYRSCTQSVSGQQPLNDCNFRNGTGKRLVALVSLPGSGNTWLRGLLQRVTGICTGSVACDPSLRREGFAGEGVRSSSVLVVKTHDSALLWAGSDDASAGQTKHRDRPHFDAAVFLIRNPFHAIVAEWNRQSAKKRVGRDGNSHIEYVGREGFGNNSEWNKCVTTQIARWKKMLTSYIIEPQRYHLIHTVYYEDLWNNALKETRKLLHFLNFPHSLSQVKKAVEQDFTQFYRNHSDNFEHYTTEQKQMISSAINWAAEGVKNKEFHSSHLRNYLP